MLDPTTVTVGDTTSMDSITAQPETRCVVTFVHGTWGRKSSFLNDDGPLQKTLRQNSDAVVTTTFRWSGSNRASSRLRAATDLGRHITNLCIEYPNARQCIVAHSHGGNVALYSLNEPSVDSMVDGIVCFSTPFINVSWRNQAASETYSFALKTLLAVPLMLLFAGMAIGILLLATDFDPLVNALSSIAAAIDPGDWTVEWVAIVALGAALALAIVLGIVAGPMMIVSPLVDRWEDLADRHRRGLRIPSIDENRLLIIRTVADEASRVIAVSGLISWVVSAIYEFFHKYTIRPFFVVGARIEEFHNEGDTNPLEFLFLAAAFLISIAIMLLGGTLVGIPLLTSVTLMGLTGLSYPSTSLFLLVSAESTPHGSHKIHLYDAEHDPAWLAHSSSYMHQPAIENAVRWILQRPTVVESGHSGISR